MRVLQINVVCGQGSTGRIAVDIANLLKSKGNEAYIAYGYGTTDYQESYKITTNTETRINAHIFARLGLQGRGTKYGTKRLIKWMDKIKPDIIHLHNIHGLYINYKLLFDYIIKNDIPVVWTIHDCWPVTGHCAHFVLAHCEKWKHGCHDCHYDGVYKERSLIDNSRSAFSFKKTLFTAVPNMHLVPVSKWMESVIKESYLGGFPSTVIYNGIDLSFFKHTPSGIKERLSIYDKHLILAVSSQWNDDKGLSDYIKLAQLLPDDFIIVLVGLREKQIPMLPCNVRGIAKTEKPKDLVELYSAADVVLSLSHAESMGLTIVESMACGTPVIAYNNTAQTELVSPGTGFVVSDGDVSSVYLKIIEVIKEKNKIDYSKICRERVVSLFNKSEQYLNYYALYQNVLDLAQTNSNLYNHE